MSATEEYVRRVNYYETDRMGIVHHSNYIRWMEEARTEFMRLNGVDYELIEKKGVMIPVTGVSCEFKRSATFGDTVRIRVTLRSFNGVRAEFGYEIYMEGSGELLVTGESEHCFIDDQTRRPQNLKRRLPEESEVLLELLRDR